MYRYFIQPIINKFSGSVIGYELLIRELIDGQWQLPQCFSAIPQEVQTNLLVTIAQKLSRKISFVSFNVNWAQFSSPEFSQLLIETQQKISPVTLVLEIIEEPVQTNFSTTEIIQQMNYFNQHGVLIALDDVDTGCNLYPEVQAFLPYVFEIKFPCQNFRQAGRQTEIKTALQKWQQIAANNNLNLVVEGVETAADDQLLDELENSYRQGYYYGKPRLFQ